MVSKRVWLGDRSILEASLMSLYTNHFLRTPHATAKKLQNKNMIQRQIVPQMVNSCSRGKNPIKPGFHRLINWRTKSESCNQCVWMGKGTHHRAQDQDGAIPINVMITQQCDNTLYNYVKRLTALLYDQSNTFNSKHCCERCLHG